MYVRTYVLSGDTRKQYVYIICMYCFLVFSFKMYVATYTRIMHAIEFWALGSG